MQSEVEKPFKTRPLLSSGPDYRSPTALEQGAFTFEEETVSYFYKTIYAVSRGPAIGAVSQPDARSGRGTEKAAIRR